MPHITVKVAQMGVLVGLLRAAVIAAALAGVFHWHMKMNVELDGFSAASVTSPVALPASGLPRTNKPPKVRDCKRTGSAPSQVPSKPDCSLDSGSHRE